MEKPGISALSYSADRWFKSNSRNQIFNVRNSLMRGGFSQCDSEREPLPGQEAKQMPSGQYMFVHQLPGDCTDVELQEFLASIGIPLPLENVAVTPYNGYMCGAVFSVPAETIAMLVNWAINGALLRGKSVVDAKAPVKKKGAR
jgi:hypothetical protein